MKKKKRYMDKKDKNTAADQRAEAVYDDEVTVNDIDNEDIDQADAEAAKDLAQEAMDEKAELQKKFEDTSAELEKQKKEYLFLMAEFDNFRKRTLKEKSELIRNAGENVLKGLLPIVDDFERSLQALDSDPDLQSAKEGVSLIYNKLVKYLEQNGVKAIDSAAGTTFDTELHEAVTTFPADEDQKGKVIDTVQKGYTLNDKVLRHAKVVVGQ